MTEIGEFPDAEQVMVDLLSEFGHACTFMPPDRDEFAAKLPIIWISRNGGACDDITDRPVLNVAVFSEKRSLSWQVSGKCREKILAAGGSKVNGIKIDVTREVSGVVQLPDKDPLQRMVQATYGMSFRRRFT